MSTPADSLPPPLVQPLGDRALIVRFATVLNEAANRQATAFYDRLRLAVPDGVEEVVPNLVSVLLRYDPLRIGYDRLAGELRLLLTAGDLPDAPPVEHRIAMLFDGPDLADVAAALGLTPSAFVAAHGRSVLHVLATGFAPGFVYCGFHPPELAVPRRAAVRSVVPAGTVLFAARQTAITSTPVPTGWHVIGHTAFRNFDPAAMPPTRLRQGDAIAFEALS